MKQFVILTNEKKHTDSYWLRVIRSIGTYSGGGYCSPLGEFVIHSEFKRLKVKRTL